MDLSKYRSDVIGLYSTTISNYFLYIQNRNDTGLVYNDCLDAIRLQYSCWKVIIQILAMMYLVNMNIEQLDVYMERSYILFNEYVGKIYTKEFSEMHTPTMFVNKVLIGNISFSAYESKPKHPAEDSTFFIMKLSKWSELILAWENQHISIKERLYFNKMFTSPILNLVLDDTLYHTYRIIETLQNTFDSESYSTRHSLLLTSLHSFFTANNNLDFTTDDVQNIMFRMFFQEKDTLEEKFMAATTISDMDSFVTWMFVNK